MSRRRDGSCTALAVLQMSLDLRRLFVGQAGKRRPLAGDADLIADFDQLVIIDIQFLSYARRCE